MIRISGVGVKFDTWVLKEINLFLEPNYIYGIIGKSGSGKTTLLKIIAGLQDRNEGEVFLEEKYLQGPSERLVAGYDDIQLVNQDFNLDVYQTVYENVKGKILSRKKEVQEELIDEFLELVELNGLKDRKAIFLSGGEQQRLAIARALACEPKVLLLDEPFVHIDQRLRWKILQYLKELRSAFEMLIILVSHDGAEVMGFTDRVIHLENAMIVREDETKNMYYQPFDKAQGELMGEINQVKMAGKDILFRPNEYVLENANLNVSFEKSIDVGLTVLNYFKTENGESILLTNPRGMAEVSKIRIENEV